MPAQKFSSCCHAHNVQMLLSSVWSCLKLHFHYSCWRLHECTTLDYYSGHHWTGCECTPISGTLSDGHAMTGTWCDHASLVSVDIHDSVLCVYSVLIWLSSGTCII